ncbi:dipeptide epimerase [Rhodoferax sp.]|uniref:dipeptide epimerase n=1 Tax=Rhodoferax sp. TaxID=50421 RepID=UPI00374CDC59
MKIEEIQIGKVSIPLKKPFKTALRRVDSAEDIIIKVITDTSEVGFGNAPPTAVITGDSQDSIIASIRDTLGPKIIGMPINNLEGIMTILDAGMLHNHSAKAALDIAVHDLFGKCFGLPLYKLFGGFRTSLETDLTISLNSPEEMVRDALEAVAQGYTALKLKVGNDPALDVQRVQAIRGAVGRAIKIRLDANQGWGAKEAVRIIQRFETDGLDIELVEQPVKAHDLEGLKYVTDRVATDIMADESAFGPFEVFQLLSLRACDLINIKLMKAGGLHNALKIVHFAETMDVQCMIGCMLECKIGITAAASLAGGKRIITRADLDAAVLLAEDPVVGGVSFCKNQLLIPDAPGLGITDIIGWQPVE